MVWFINQSLFIVLAAFLLGLLVGWLLWGGRRPSPSPADDTVARPASGDHDLRPVTTSRPATREHSVPPVVTDHDIRPIPTEHNVPPVTTDHDIRPVPTEHNVPPTTDHQPRPGTDTPPVADGVTATTTTTEPDDDLERIEGIGPKMAAALRAAGIHTFGQLAQTDDDTRRTAIEAAGLSFAPSLVTWGRQAQLLADGDEEGFDELTRRLVAGRETGRI
ncbi:helix-hairpin-helix domain-containing protein [Plantactinospora sonchi]|uniref:Helix-hairpin-helix domain-containing protein n=1 Tax=Plantactinospora sonchi TaxID=1544735 RepID=A0ABU7S1V0_9ACTN